MEIRGISELVSFPKFPYSLFLALLSPGTYILGAFPQSLPADLIMALSELGPPPGAQQNVCCFLLSVRRKQFVLFPWPCGFTSRLILDALCSPTSCACAIVKGQTHCTPLLRTKHGNQDKIDSLVDKSKAPGHFVNVLSDHRRLDFCDFSFIVLSSITNGLTECPGEDLGWHLHLNKKRNGWRLSPGEWGGLFLLSAVSFVQIKDPKVGSRMKAEQNRPHLL